jgi:hypothetical protein
LNGEPYYAGYSDPRGLGAVNYTRGAKGGTDKDNAIVRSGSYGCFLSGGYAGHVYGAEGIWGGDIEPEAPVKMWDAFNWKSADEMRHLKTFALSLGERYRDLEPQTDLVTPNKTHDVLSYEGWAYCSRTPDRKNFLVYFESGCPLAEIRGAELNGIYKAQWFNPRTGTWSNVGDGKVTSSKIGIIKLPHKPDDLDWGLRLVYDGAVTAEMYRAAAAAQSKLAKEDQRLSDTAKRFIIGAVIVALFCFTVILERKNRRA